MTKSLVGIIAVLYVFAALSKPTQVEAAYFLSTVTIKGWCDEAKTLSACHAYLQAVADGLDASPEEIRKSVHSGLIVEWRNGVCFPPELHQEDLRKVFLAYLQALPGPPYGTSPADVAADAFAFAWPC